jgi:hypothetical protein
MCATLFFFPKYRLPERYTVLNEAVIDRGPSPYLSVLDLACDAQYITTLQGDGIIFATPTGSTAYSLSGTAEPLSAKRYAYFLSGLRTVSISANVFLRCTHVVYSCCVLMLLCTHLMYSCCVLILCTHLVYSRFVLTLCALQREGR